MVLTLVYTNLSITPLWLIIILNILLFMGIMSRMIPSTAITLGVPEMADRGAFTSINSSLQQIAGGVATLLAGVIIVQKDNFSPLENYPVLGIIGVSVMMLTIWLLGRVNKIVNYKTKKGQT
jgi:predicted MFS family arabinose efflux permease